MRGEYRVGKPELCSRLLDSVIVVVLGKVWADMLLLHVLVGGGLVSG